MTTTERIARLWSLDLTQSSPIEIPNVDRWHSLTKLFADLEFHTGAEIGVERGQFSKRLCTSNPGLKLYCIDPWLAFPDYREHITQSKLDRFFSETQQRLAPYNCTIIRKTSIDAAADIPNKSLDFIYIDANHSLLHIIQDLCHWIPKVRRGGVISGHDYARSTNKRLPMHVIEGVNAYVRAYNIKQWFLLGRKDIIPGELRDKSRSFMWVKE